MELNNEALERAIEVSGNTKLQARTVASHRPLCVGATLDPDETGVTTTLLTKGAQAVISTTPEPKLGDVYWVWASQHNGGVLYQWKSPLGLRHSFVGVVDPTPSADVQAACDRTMLWLKQRQTALSDILETGIRTTLLGKISQVAGFFRTAEVVHLSAVLLKNVNGDSEAFRAEVIRLHHMIRNDLEGIRLALPPSAANHSDEYLQGLVRGLRVISHSIM